MGSKKKQYKRRNGQVPKTASANSNDAKPESDNRHSAVDSPPTLDIASGSDQVVTMTQEMYDKERALILDLLKANTDQHDKAVLQITAAALGFSVVFGDKIYRESQTIFSAYFLGVGWLCLGFGLLAVVVSFQTGVFACRAQLSILDGLLNGIHTPKSNRWTGATDLLTRLAGCLLIFGVSFVLVFCWVNLSGPRAADSPHALPGADLKMAQDKENPGSKPLEKTQGGYVPPPPPKIKKADAPSTGSGVANPSSPTPKKE